MCSFFCVGASSPPSADPSSSNRGSLLRFFSVSCIASFSSELELSSRFGWCVSVLRGTSNHLRLFDYESTQFVLLRYIVGSYDTFGDLQMDAGEGSRRRRPRSASRRRRHNDWHSTQDRWEGRHSGRIPLHQKGRYTKDPLHQKDATPKGRYTKRTLHQSDTTPKGRYTKRTLHQKDTTPTGHYTKH